MSQTVTISLDAMGGDSGPDVVIGGAAIAIDRRPDLRFVIFGDEHAVRPVLDAYPRVQEHVGVPSLRRGGADGRQAEPGAAQGALEIVHVAVGAGGAGRRGGRRRLGRQYRRADGHGESSA